MKLTIQPPWRQWHVPAAASADDHASRQALAEVVNCNADRLGTGRLRGDRPILATGHQAFFWHPGILAKDIAVTVAAEAHDGDRLHVVVDQDVHDVSGLDVPHVVDERIVVERVRLGSQRVEVPTGSHPPVTFDTSHPHLPAVLTQAVAGLPACRSLAEQVTVALARLREPYAPAMPVVFASQLPQLPVFAACVERMLADASACVLAYNRAAAAHPKAGIAALQWTRERIELPLWQLQPDGPRRRVFADLADSTPLLVNDDDAPVNDRRTLAPRALLLTAQMRSALCDLFVHGLGGGTYDHVMEQWWHDWHGGPLAPMAVATADVHLAFDAPVADRAALDRAVWYAHHLPHNVGRALGADADGARQRKDALLASMRATRDRRRRRAAFDELHRINDELAAAHPDLLAAADAQLARARIAIANAAAARRRDWSIALYPAEALAALGDAVQMA